MAAKHTYRFVEEYQGIGAFGWSREADEETLKYYLQKFSDDAHLDFIIKKMTAEELDTFYSLINTVLKNHLTEKQYHRIFLKDGTH
jgi:hypothetical protein